MPTKKKAKSLITKKMKGDKPSKPASIGLEYEMASNSNSELGLPKTQSEKEQIKYIKQEIGLDRMKKLMKRRSAK